MTKGHKGICPFCGRPAQHGWDGIVTVQKGTRKVIVAHRNCVYKGKEPKP